MKTLSFTEKNDFLVHNKNENYFSKDLKLFQKHFPIHQLNNELARVNQFTRERLDAQMLYELLSIAPPEEILQNRGVEIPVNPLPEKESKKEAVNENRETVTNPPDPEPEEKPENESASIQALQERILSLEESSEINTEDIDTLRLELEDRDFSIEGLQSQIEALEEKALKKKGASRKSSPK